MQKPNLLVVFADQWRGTAVGFRDEQVLTPNIDKFAETSFYTEEAVTGCPLCSPYRGELLTGRHTAFTGIFGNCMTGYNFALAEDEICISDILKKEGYRTGYIGKWHLDMPERNSCVNPLSGAEGWDAYTPPGRRRHGFDYWYAYNASNNHLHQHYWHNTAEKLYASEWSPIHETGKAIDFIEKSSNAPFALFLSWNPPHPPFSEVPKEYSSLYKEEKIRFCQNVQGSRFDNQTGELGIQSEKELREAACQYFGAVSGLDEQFGRLLDYLQKKDLLDNTIILLTADHGEHLGSHGYVGKHTWFEESIGVPFILRYPSKVPQGKNNIFIQTVDIFPILFGIMGFAIPDTVQGRDLSKYIENGTRPEQNRAFSSAYVSRDIFLEAYKNTGKDFRKSGWRCIKTPEYKYVIEKGYMPNCQVRHWLYSRENDPYEMTPLITNDFKENEVMKKLHEELWAHLIEIGDMIYLS